MRARYRSSLALCTSWSRISFWHSVIARLLPGFFMFSENRRQHTSSMVAAFFDNFAGAAFAPP